ncbi:carbohydrate ABC transporter permease [Paenibacillus urinalis]|uniref:Carbohydrate ABC transporter permease n=1 Tax=Paenibacillus urinalis TaxID=521520 RepID=A0AAX3MYW2_9BACL|nr:MULTISPECIES: carbohydrate ABC transporter permease [Paenibacillus]WDH82472.1 carbohydrate ABC transporter permease [Paenibacillus urinalis]WDH98528.1 carbohydrate ABC transporter permease [Paenibacillus urinalis]WDI02219.1 carbohydrate ABC transporter permease [Paenibacillus urinalis]GAK40102.1 sugar ABC transporter permease protein [Paenibacillus sp. TCA20]
MIQARLKSIGLYVGLAIGLVISMFPFYWLIVMSTRTTADIYSFPPKLWFGGEFWNNLTRVMEQIDFVGAFLNTLFVSAVVTILVLFFDSLAGFAFAKFEFPGKKWLFVLLLATMMVPTQLSLVPSFVIMAELGWVGSYKALIIPGMVNAFGIFWIRQYAEGSIPKELLDAGRMDGAGFFRLYFNVALPILRPAFAFLGAFTFIGVWNDYLWPLIVLTDESRYTLQIALSQLNGLYNTDYAMIIAGTLLAIIPLIILFLFISKQFISDIAAGAIKD